MPKQDNSESRDNTPDIVGYEDFLRELKTRMSWKIMRCSFASLPAFFPLSSAQLRAAISVNKELVLLYWQIGRDILDRQQQGWGAKVINRHSS